MERQVVYNSIVNIYSDYSCMVLIAGSQSIVDSIPSLLVAGPSYPRTG